MKRHPAKTRKELFRLNIHSDEIGVDVAAVIIDHTFDQDPDKRRRSLRTQVGDLKRSLEVMENQLLQANDEKDAIVKERESEQERTMQFEERQKFLLNHICALESEVTDAKLENTRLRSENAALCAEEKKMTESLGRKRLADCSADSVTRTKQAYRHKFGESIDKFGANRGLVLKKMVLKDNEGGQDLEINMAKSSTYANLNEEQRENVVKASCWKDRERVSDKSYARLKKVTEMPAASHVKAHEREMNQKIGSIVTVG